MPIYLEYGGIAGVPTARAPKGALKQRISLLELKTQQGVFLLRNIFPKKSPGFQAGLECEQDSSRESL